MAASENEIFDYLFRRRYGRWTSRGGPTSHHIRQLEAYRTAVIRKKAAQISDRVAKANRASSLRVPLALAAAIVFFFITLALVS